jgi:hypothetical protein
VGVIVGVAVETRVGVKVVVAVLVGVGVTTETLVDDGVFPGVGVKD